MGNVIDYEKIAKYCRRRQLAMWQDRQKYDELDKQICDAMAPDIGDGYHNDPTDKSAGSKRNDRRILNDTPVRAALSCGAGMMNNITPPGRPWFRFDISVADPSEKPGVETREWFDRAADFEARAFAVSGTYDALHESHRHLAVLGRSCLLVREDPRTIFRTTCLVAGTYATGYDGHGGVNAVTRCFAMTGAQLAEEYGEENVPERIRNKIGKAGGELLYKCWQLIEPNLTDDGEPADDIAEMLTVIDHFPCRSIHWVEAQDNADKNRGILAIRGFRVNPIVAPRYSISGGNLFGCGIGKRILGTCQALQKLEEFLMQAVAVVANPPVNAPAELKQVGVRMAPGGVNYVNGDGNRAGVTVSPVFAASPNIRDPNDYRKEYEARIRAAFHVDLFMTLLSDQTKNRTAYEVEQLKREAMEQLGPIIEALDKELLDKIVMLGYWYCVKAGAGPFANIPNEVATHDGGRPRIEYVSSVHAAMRAAQVNSVLSFTQHLTQVSQVLPEILDNLDPDGVYLTLHDMTMVPASISRNDQEVKQLRMARAQAQQAELQKQGEQRQVEMAAKMGGMKTEGTVAGNAMREQGNERRRI